MAFSPDRYVRTLHFAARAHGDQQTPFGVPYVVHLSCVAMELMRGLGAEPGRDEDLAISCALLHDTLEDTALTLAQLEAEFGPKVAAGVSALTKDGSLEKSRRMADSLARIGRQPAEIAMVKLSDRISNLAPPPQSWSSEKVAAYREEAALILQALGGASPFLAARLRERLFRYPAG